MLDRRRIYVVYHLNLQVLVLHKSQNTNKRNDLVFLAILHLNLHATVQFKHRVNLVANAAILFVVHDDFVQPQLRNCFQIPVTVVLALRKHLVDAHLRQGLGLFQLPQKLF